jgi:hypothetical protein
MQDWLGRHSRWSQLQPWTVVHSGKRTLIYRAGTAYEKLKYAQFVSELQTFARLWSAAVETMNRERVTVSGSLHSENDRHPLDVQSSRTELDQLLDQAPVRNLTPYWRMRTRIEPVLLVLCVFLGCLSAGFASGKLVTWIHRVTGIVLDQSWGIVMAVVLAGVIAVVACRQHWWSHRRNRRLLKTGEVTSGGVDHFTERNGNRSQDASLYQVQVTYNALDATHTAKWSLFVSDVRAAALTRTAEVDRQVVVLFDPSRPDCVVLPELLAFCR